MKVKPKTFNRTVAVTIKGKQEGEEYSVAKCYNEQCTWPGYANEDHETVVKYGRNHQC